MDIQKTMKVKCPHDGCGAVLTIPDTPGIADRMLSCPVCKYRDKVSVFIAEMEKQNDDDTEICFSDRSDTIGTLRVGDVDYHLTEGENTIGRKAASSNADVQLAVDDKRMSREHVCVSVIKMPKGDYQHTIRNVTTKNSVFVNGKEMQEGEMIILQYGDVVRLGKTDIQFVRL